MRKRIALLFSGLPRQWSHCAESHANLFRQNDTEVFFHFWDTIDAEEKQRIVEAYKPKAHHFQAPIDFSWADCLFRKVDNINVPSRMLSMYYSWKRVASLFQRYREANGVRYDYALRLRADLMFFDSIDGLLASLEPDEILLSDHNNFKIINDMFALGGVDPILYYHSLYDQLTKYQEHEVFSPERMLRYHLNHNPRGFRVLSANLTMLVFRPHMIGIPLEECLKQHPGASKWLDPEIVAAHKESHGRRNGERGHLHVEEFKKIQIRRLEKAQTSAVSRHAVDS